ncbi:4,5-DOPA dioxygenase extradiol [Ornithinimicrobium humiphilum]|uniref:4,5-DOPA dioxygenase extradiol n=1 Tax=Ornithinimicrobium humiphilum TaxID=125288 RepID=A0A543KP05_9MICO|nr:4,5-DOPA dioxygenase extradiol [Ornithinimicrobium humiphilum]TQM96802.1 4,5-DOPA dioxygenase extradiol [Ornithinimicrobium humiphilum]
MSATTRMPAAFLGHGNPMNALERNRYTEAWRLFGRSVPRPRAILVVSAHWYTNATAVTSMPRPRTIHDFYGFPQELFDVQYPAPGAPDVAELVADVVKPTWVGQDIDSWGIDHGTWSVLLHAFPDASVPVVQLSLNAFKSFDHHLELGRKLGALRDEGVLVVGSGNVVHNLHAVDFTRPDEGYDWARRFDDVARETLMDDPAQVAALDSHPDFAAAVPTPDHYLPLLYIAGLADGEPLDPLVDGHAAGSISMAAYTLGLDLEAARRAESEAEEGAADLPPGFPALDANI